MNFSIVIVTYNRKKYLERCLKSIKQQASSKFQFEVIIIFNGEMSYFSSVKREFSGYHSYYIPKTTPSHARNYGVTKCQGKYVFFLDDDCYLPENYFDNLNLNLDWDVLGGPDMTPPDANAFEKNLGHALASPLCMGFTYKRHHVHSTEVNIPADESKLILCNLWFKREIFSEQGFKFPTNLFRNEENFLLKQLKDDNKIILYNSKLAVFHSRKDDLKSLALTIAKSGECRVKNFSQLPESQELIYFLPMVFLSFFFYWIFNPLSILGYGFLAYTFMVIFYVVFYKKQMKPMVVILHYLILIFYAFGLLVGMKKYLEFYWGKREKNKSLL